MSTGISTFFIGVICLAALFVVAMGVGLALLLALALSQIFGKTRNLFLSLY